MPAEEMAPKKQLKQKASPKKVKVVKKAEAKKDKVVKKAGAAEKKQSAKATTAVVEVPKRLPRKRRYSSKSTEEVPKPATEDVDDQEAEASVAETLSATSSSGTSSDSDATPVYPPT